MSTQVCTVYVHENKLFVKPLKKVSFSLFSSILLENSQRNFVKTKIHDGSICELKKHFAELSTAYFQQKINKNIVANDFLDKLVGYVEFKKHFLLKYCIDETKIVIKKIEELQIIEENEKKEELFESFKKIDINLNLNVDEQLFQKKWENKSYDIISSKRKLRSISLIREIHRDMVCARFMSNQIIYVKIFLKFLENLNQYLLIKSYLNNINI